MNEIINTYRKVTIGTCKRCGLDDSKLRKWRHLEFCNMCWIEIWESTLHNSKNKTLGKQKQILMNLKICLGER